MPVLSALDWSTPSWTIIPLNIYTSSSSPSTATQLCASVQTGKKAPPCAQIPRAVPTGYWLIVVLPPGSAPRTRQLDREDNPDAAGKEGRVKKSALPWVTAAANKSFQSLFWKLTLLGDLQCSLEHTQQMQWEHYYWWINIQYFCHQRGLSRFQPVYLSTQGPSEVLSKSIPGQWSF